MTKYDEYCYNLMESAIRAGAQTNGMTKDTCIAYMNIMFGVRGVESYIDSTTKTFEEQIEDVKDFVAKRTESYDAMTVGTAEREVTNTDGKTMGD